MSQRLLLPFLALISALLVAFGCTPWVSETSPRGERNRSSTGAIGESAMRLWDVIDRAARWQTKVTALEEPEVVTQPGYVHVRVRTPDPRPVDCFLYDSPIITGQALVRLLNAAEIGIEYQGMALEAVLLSAKNPLVILSASYQQEDKGPKGTLFVGIVPRVKIPIVCSHEAKSSRSMKATIDRLSRGLEPESDFSSDSLAEGETLLAFQLWAIFRNGRPIGFRQWRAAKNKAGEVSTLEIASLLESRDKTLTATDIRISERADAEGVLLSDWLELLDGELHVKAALERLAPESSPEAEGGALFSYRVAELGPEGPVASTLTTTEPIRSSFFAHQEFSRAEASGGETQFLAFLPSFQVSQATRLHYRAAPRGGASKERRGELEVGDSSFELVWEGGQLTRRRETRSGIESRLLFPLPNAEPFPGEASAPSGGATLR